MVYSVDGGLNTVSNNSPVLKITDNILTNEKRNIPHVNLVFFEENEYLTKDIFDLFNGKRILLFSSRGAFTYVSSEHHLINFEQKYEDIISYGIDEIYCISIDNPLVIHNWANSLGISKVKMIPDSNGSFTEKIGMKITQNKIGIPFSSWRYCAVIENNQIQWIIEEEGKADENLNDEYNLTTPDVVIDYLKLNMSLKFNFK